MELGVGGSNPPCCTKIMRKEKNLKPSKELPLGFVDRQEKEKDVFVHSSAAREANLELREGDELTFDVENGEKGPSAVNMQKA